MRKFIRKQSKKIQNILIMVCYLDFSKSGFPCLKKRVGISKKISVILYPTIFIHTFGPKTHFFFWSDSRKCTACRWYDLNLIPLPAPHCRYTFSSSIGTERKIVQRKPAFLPCCISISHFYILYLTENYFFFNTEI